MNDRQSQAVSRRRLLGFGVAGLGAVAFPGLASAARRPARALAFENLHTGETLRTVYWADGAYIPAALGEIDRILRDFRTGEVARMDPALIDLLFALKRRMGAAAPFGIVSGYRSPRTNAMLRRTGGGGVAKRSLHMDGMAVDVRLRGCRLDDLRRAALSLRAGGVGYYPESGFLHLDTGRVRFW